jgi:aspartate carbamoyltransferase catalytic subunit
MSARISLPEFLALPDAEKVKHVGHGSILFAQQFDRADLDAYCTLADAARALHKTPEGALRMAALLRHRMALNFFVQPSSRTFMSFNTAQAYLGLNRMSVRDVDQLDLQGRTARRQHPDVHLVRRPSS